MIYIGIKIIYEVVRRESQQVS